MLSSYKLKREREEAGMSVDELAGAVTPSNLPAEAAEVRRAELRSAIRNWEHGLMKPVPKTDDIARLARALQVEPQEISVWAACHRYAPIAPRKVRLVTELINGRTVQDALDVLKFANKRAAVIVDKVLRSAVANADEQEADVDKLYVSEARVDEGGVRQGTRRWRPKDRGRAVPFTRLCSHIHVSVDME